MQLFPKLGLDTTYDNQLRTDSEANLRSRFHSVIL